MPSRDICEVSLTQPQEGEDRNENYEYITAVVSSGTLDSHGTRMSAQTLQNFADRLNNDAIQFKDSHDRGNGFGVSTDAIYKDGKVIASFRLRKDWTLNNGISSNQIIEGIREGIITKTSVGFSGGDYICDICNDDYMRTRCDHYPNYKYMVKGDDDVEREVVASYTIDNAEVTEVSAVYDGSNPDAKILEKAESRYREGRLPVEVQTHFERAYGVRFSNQDKKTNNVNLNDGGVIVEPKELQQQLESVTTERDEARAEVEKLKPLAECGEEARKYMANEALTAFKVAKGEKCQEADVTKFQTRTAKYSFADLVMEVETWRELAPEAPEVKSGSNTTQPDNSGNPDGSRNADQKKDARAIVNPPWWGGKGARARV